LGKLNSSDDLNLYEYDEIFRIFFHSDSKFEKDSFRFSSEGFQKSPRAITSPLNSPEPSLANTIGAPSENQGIPIAEFT
jgi:hypothetical protein